MRELTIALAATLGVWGAAGTARAAPTSCAPPGSERQVEASVRGFFDAAHRDDLATLAAIQGPGFYAYDNGERYEGMKLGELVKAAHGQGTEIEWNLHDFDVHVGCDQAWAAWVNTGAVGVRGQMQPVTWLESATFVWSGNGWRMAFLHSDRASAVAPQRSLGGQRRGRR